MGFNYAAEDLGKSISFTGQGLGWATVLRGVRQDLLLGLVLVAGLGPCPSGDPLPRLGRSGARSEFGGPTG